MIPIHMDGNPFELDTSRCGDVGELLGAFDAAVEGRVITSIVLNGWERLDAHDEGARSIPIELVSTVWIETETMGDAVRRALRSAGELAFLAATTASRAGEAFQEGRDGEGHLGFGELCRFATDLQSLAETLHGVPAKPAAAQGFVDVWEGRCASALRALVDAGSARDHVLMADHLLYDVAPAFEALGAEGSPA